MCTHTRSQCFTSCAVAGCGTGFEVMNRPRCLWCGGPSRPTILMFNDLAWLDTDPMAPVFRWWEECVCAEARADSSIRVAIVEVGCGNNVPTIRGMTQSLLSSLPEHQGTLIRINPEFPLYDRDISLIGDSDSHEAEHRKQVCSQIISIMDTGLSALRRIDNAMRKSEQM